MASPLGNMSAGASALMSSPADQVKGETDDQRKKRLMAMQASKQLPAGVSSMAQDYGSALTMS